MSRKSISNAHLLVSAGSDGTHPARADDAREGGTRRVGTPGAARAPGTASLHQTPSPAPCHRGKTRTVSIRLKLTYWQNS